MTTGQNTEWVAAFWADERGVTSIEYALLGVLIAVAIAGSVTLVGGEVAALYGRVVSAFP